MEDGQGEESLAGEDEARARAYAGALRLLRLRPRSVAEVERYLARRGVGKAIAAQVVESLQEADLLDDAAFARFWVAEREALNPKGVRALRYELARLGVAREVVAEALGGLDEAESAYRAARPRLERFARLDWPEFSHRLGEYLARRGFGHSVVKDALARLWQER